VFACDRRDLPQAFRGGGLRSRGRVLLEKLYFSPLSVGADRFFDLSNKKLLCGQRRFLREAVFSGVYDSRRGFFRLLRKIGLWKIRFFSEKRFFRASAIAGEVFSGFSEKMAAG